MFNAQLQNYLNSLGQRAQIIGNQHANTTGAYLNQENAFNSQFQNYVNGLMQRAQIVGNEHANTTGALLNQENAFNSQFQNYLNALAQMGKLDADGLNNLMTALVNQMNGYNYQLGNYLNATTQQANFSNQKYVAETDAIKSGAEYQQTLFKDGIEVDSAQLNARANEMQIDGDYWRTILQALKQRNDTNAQWYGISKNVSDTAWTHTMAALEAASGWYRNRLSGLQLYTQLWDTYINHATKRIAMSAAAQEAAQNAAIRLWNASIGLNQSATGVLVALSNQGTKTTTQEQSSGSFWGGLFGGVASAFAGGYAGAFGKSMFGG